MPLRPRYLLTALLVLACAVALFAAHRWYEGRYLRAFDNRAEVFDGDRLRLPDALAGPGPVRFVHFWDPACPCNVGNQQHLAELLARYRERGVAFFVVQKPGSKGQLPKPLQGLTPLAGLRGSEQLPASPAVGIWDAEGRLAYLGPYSEGAACNAENSFVEPILEAILDGRAVRAANTMAVACFCDWK